MLMRMLAMKLGGAAAFAGAAAAGALGDLPTSSAPAPVQAAAAAQAPAPAAAAAAAETPFVIRRILDIPGPIKMGQWFWDEDGVPAGPVVITVDLHAQTLSVFRGGYEIGATAILYGADEKPTPLGAYPITQKKVDHVSNLYGAPMPYMLRLTNDGISIHGAEVEAGAATHGCIGVPTPFAKKLFAAVRLGDTVIITRGKQLGMGESIVG